MIPAFLLQFALLSSTTATAKQPLLLPAQCITQTLHEMFAPPHPLTEKLNDVVTLKNQINAILADPEIPKEVKRVIRRSLEEDIDVIQLTRTVKSQRNIGKSNGVQSTKFKNIVIRKSKGSPNLNEERSGQMNMHGLPNQYTVFLKQALPTRKFNPLMTLIHELAHTKMSAFLDEYIPQLAERFPRDLIKRLEDGRHEINSDLYSFITEKYAMETEYRLLKAAHGKYIENWTRTDRFGQGPGLHTDEEMSRRISEHIIEVYKIADPQVLELRERTLHDILTRGIPSPFDTPFDF